jgi:hypothetical protein
MNKWMHHEGVGIAPGDNVCICRIDSRLGYIA